MTAVLDTLSGIGTVAGYASTALSWWPWIAGALGVASGGALFFVPSLAKWAPWIIAAVAVIGGGGYGLIERDNYQTEKAARAGDREAAAQAVIDQKKADEVLSAEIVGRQQQQLAALADKAGAAIQQVYHEPVSTSCAQSLPMRDATRSLHQLFDSGAGQPPAGRQPAAAVRGPGAR